VFACGMAFSRESEMGVLAATVPDLASLHYHRANR
jgi:hypothetical protein